MAFESSYAAMFWAPDFVFLVFCTVSIMHAGFRPESVPPLAAWQGSWPAPCHAGCRAPSCRLSALSSALSPAVARSWCEANTCETRWGRGPKVFMRAPCWGHVGFTFTFDDKLSLSCQCMHACIDGQLLPHPFLTSGARIMSFGMASCSVLLQARPVAPDGRA